MATLPVELKMLSATYKIKYSDKVFLKPKVYKAKQELTVFASHQSHFQDVLEAWIKKEAKIFVMDRVRKLALLHNFTYNRISLRDQSTRWGSCSSSKNLNFNWRLIFAPVEILDYVIIHELAHTREMNHSANFWTIVATTMPDYEKHRKWLRDNESYLKKLW